MAPIFMAQNIVVPTGKQVWTAVTTGEEEKWARMTGRQKSIWDTRAERVTLQIEKDLWQYELDKDPKLQKEWIITDHGVDYDGRLMELDYKVYRAPTAKAAVTLAKKIVKKHWKSHVSCGSEEGEEFEFDEEDTSFEVWDGCMKHEITITSVDGDFLTCGSYTHC